MATSQSMSGSLGDDGFQSAKDSLTAITNQNNQLQQQISSGQLVMNPTAANNAGKAYDHAADSVDALITGSDQLNHIVGLGSYPSGQQLAVKFQDKARNGSSGALDLLGQLADELRRKADLFRQACRDYQSREEQRAQDMGRVSR